MIEGRVAEAQRIARETNNILKAPKIIPYFWYRYRDVEEYLSKVSKYLFKNLFFAQEKI